MDATHATKKGRKLEKSKEEIKKTTVTLPERRHKDDPEVQYYPTVDYDFHGEPELKDLMEWISPQVASQWMLTGVLLSIPIGSLEAIKFDYPEVNDALLAVFIAWRKIKCSPYSWKTILKVLATDNIGHRRLADDIAQRLSVRKCSRGEREKEEQTISWDQPVHCSMAHGQGSVDDRTDLERKYTEVSETLEKERKLLSLKNSKMEDTEQLVKLLHAHIKNQDEKMKSLKNEVALLENDISVLKESMTLYEKEMKEKDKQMEKLKKSEKQNKDVISKLKQEKKELEEKHHEHHVQLEMMSKISRSKSAQITELQREETLAKDLKNQYKKWADDINEEYKKVCEKLKEKDAIIQRFKKSGVCTEVPECVGTRPRLTPVPTGLISQAERDVLVLRLSDPKGELSFIEMEKLRMDYISLLRYLKNLGIEIPVQKQAQEQQQQGGPPEWYW